jgi:hypothetical protein
LTSLRKILALLTPHERRRAALLLGMILVMAFLDMVGVASIMPFMAVLASPGVIETNPYLNALYTRLNFTEQAVLDAIHALGHEITIILIAHRLSTVRESGSIYLPDMDRLAGPGYLRRTRGKPASHPQCRAMARSWASG